MTQVLPFATTSTGLLDPLATWRRLTADQQERIGVAALVQALGLLGETEGLGPAQGWHAAEAEGMQALAESVRDAVAPEGVMLCHRPDLAPIDVHACRRCGCTQHHACPGSCSWEEADLCSACGDAERALTEILSAGSYAVSSRPSGMVLVTAPPAGGAWSGALVFSPAAWERTLTTFRAMEPDPEEIDDGDDAGAGLDSKVGDLLAASEHCVPAPIAVAAANLAEAHPAASLEVIIPLVSALANHFGTGDALDAAAATRWLTGPQAALGGSVPMQLLAGSGDAVSAAVSHVLRGTQSIDATE